MYVCVRVSFPFFFQKFSETILSGSKFECVCVCVRVHFSLDKTKNSFRYFFFLNRFYQRVLGVLKSWKKNITFMEIQSKAYKNGVDALLCSFSHSLAFFPAHFVWLSSLLEYICMWMWVCVCAANETEPWIRLEKKERESTVNYCIWQKPKGTFSMFAVYWYFMENENSPHTKTQSSLAPALSPAHSSPLSLYCHHF